MLDQVRSALFLPASNPRALVKARDLPCDLVILDLEDAVAPENKGSARAAALAAAAEGWAPRLLAVRINGGGEEQERDLAALAAKPRFDLIVIPKVERPDDLRRLADRLEWPMLPMIETPCGLYAARDIARVPGVAGLLAGSNDLAAALRVPSRAGLTLAHQSIVLAARAAGIAVLDGVFNALADPDGFAADCAAGRDAGYDGKSLIHPNQIDTANRIFGPLPEAVEEAKALIAAARGGAERFRGRMIEAMHVTIARRTLERAGAA